VLILGRRPGESILIDGGIRLVVISCDRRGVRLGIEAPASVGIVRGEIVAQIADENRRANVAPGSEWLSELPPRRAGTAGPPTPTRISGPDAAADAADDAA
jgi:carbon storage regulator